MIKLLPFGDIQIIDYHQLLVLVIDEVLIVLRGQLKMLPFDHVVIEIIYNINF